MVFGEVTHERLLHRFRRADQSWWFIGGIAADRGKTAKDCGMPACKGAASGASRLMTELAVSNNGT